jgi:predicted DNA binding CopG/RHH family protein
MKLTKYEKSLLDAFKNKQFEIVPISRKVRATYRDAARATLAKDKSITIRLNGLDLDKIRQLAVHSGKKYQTYIGELLHNHILHSRKAA